MDNRDKPGHDEDRRDSYPTLNLIPLYTNRDLNHHRFMLIKAARHVKNAAKYSLAGFKFLVGSELAARMELYIFVFVIALYAWLGVAWVHFIIASGLLLLIIAVEALNTAVEVIIDRVSPEISETGKRAKDLGSFAVMCLIFMNLMHFGYVLSIMLWPETGVKVLAIVMVAIVFLAALYTKLRAHKPRNR